VTAGEEEEARRRETKLSEVKKIRSGLHGRPCNTSDLYLTLDNTVMD
jgi:hypothetical protein